MAWNPSPEVAAARDAARKLNADKAIVIYTTPTGQLGMASYGKTRQLCGEAGRLGDVLWQKAYDALAEGGE